MTTYTRSPGEELDDLCKDAYVVAAASRRVGRLVNTAQADRVARALRAHASRMIDVADGDLLRATAERFERLSVKTKAGGRPRSKVVSTAAAAPTQAELVAQWDVMAMSNTGHGASPDLEARRVEISNEVLRESNHRAEEQRRRQVER